MMNGADRTAGIGSSTGIRRFGALRNLSPAAAFRFAVLACTLITVLLVATSCGVSRTRTELAGRMAAEEGRAEDDVRIAELKAKIRAVDSDVDKTIESVREKGTYWRLLGLKYMDYRMWGEAARAFDEAVAIHPDHAALQYNRALCTAQMALASDDPGTREALIAKAEAGYRHSLVADDRYTPAMYALAVILVFEQDSPADAIPLLRDYLKIERSDIPARFLLARALLAVGNAPEALDLYDEIIRISDDDSEIAEANDLIARVLGGGNGS